VADAALLPAFAKPTIPSANRNALRGAVDTAPAIKGMRKFSKTVMIDTRIPAHWRGNKWFLPDV